MENCFEKFGLKIRLVTVDDAKFILDLRLDPDLSKNIHSVNSSLEKQIEWIEGYKIKEKQQKELYFIFLDNEERLGLYRIYAINENDLTIGSWVFRKDVSSKYAILADIIIKDYVFEHFPRHKLFFDVRRNNRGVLKYHSRFNPVIIAENELDIYFELPQSNYICGRKKVLEALQINDK